MKVRENKADVDVGIDDILDALDYGVQVHIEAQKGRCGLLVDPTFMAMSVDDDDLDVVVNAELEMDTWIVEFGGFYPLMAVSVLAPWGYNQAYGKYSPQCDLQPDG